MRLRFRLQSIALAASALALIVSLAACGNDDTGGDSSGGGKLAVVATTAIAGALAEAVGGDLIDLRVLARSGVDPHEYELKSDDRKAISTAEVTLRIGLDIDAFLDKAIGGSDSKVTTITDGLTIREGEGGGRDPHVWQDPLNNKAMLDAVVGAFARADNTNADTYRMNGDAAKARFDEADRQIRALIDSIPPPNRKMVTNHDAFGYFIDRYGLTFVGAVIPSVTTQSEPSSKDIGALVDLIRAQGVKAIFSESSVDPKVAREIARDTKITIVDDLYGDTLGPPGSGAETIEGMLVVNAQKIAQALR